MKKKTKILILIRCGVDASPAPKIPISLLSIKDILCSGNIFLAYKAVSQPAVPPPTITIFI